MFKEEGYDEFLAEKIRLGKEDISAGRIVSLEEAKNRWQQTIERKAAEFAQIDESHQEIVYG